MKQATSASAQEIKESAKWGPDNNKDETVALRRELGGSWGLSSRLIIRIPRVTIWVLGVVNLLTKAPDPRRRRYAC